MLYILKAFAHGRKDKMLHLRPSIRPGVMYRKKTKQIRNTEPQIKNSKLNFPHQIVQGIVS